MGRLALDENIKISTKTAQTANDAIAKLLTPNPKIEIKKTQKPQLV